MMPSRSATTTEIPTTTETTTLYWCYSCTRCISVSTGQDANAGYVLCPNCNGGFVKESKILPPQKHQQRLRCLRSRIVIDL
ncbi:hypothetical protein Bca4012_036155 [Brassica carinata]